MILISGVRATPDFFAEDDGLGDFFERLPFLAALALERQVGLLFIHREIALKDALGALDDFAGLELIGEVGVRCLQTGHFEFGANEEADGRDQANLLAGVDVLLAMLHVDDTDYTTTAEDGHGEERLVAVFGKFVEKLEARIFGGML